MKQKNLFLLDLSVSPKGYSLQTTDFYSGRHRSTLGEASIRGERQHTQTRRNGLMCSTVRQKNDSSTEGEKRGSMIMII